MAGYLGGRVEPFIGSMVLLAMTVPVVVGALGPLGATTTALWGTAYLVLTHIEGRRDAPAPRRTGDVRSPQEW